MFTFKLERPDGTPADPPMLRAAVPNWGPGDPIHVGRRTLYVIEIRSDETDESTVLVVSHRPPAA
jgi:hypothetical protein